MLAQIPAFSTLPAEFWAATAALITGAVFAAKKLLARKPPHEPPLTRAEFHRELAATHNRIGASYLALADKLDANHRDLLAALERQGTNFEHRLDQLESNLARLDERTRN